jgi:HrpA-like RNA helicase
VSEKGTNMTVREFKRLCKQAGCGQEFTVSASSLNGDRALGLSEPEYCPRHRALHARSYSRIACHHYDVDLTRDGEELVRTVERCKKVETEDEADVVGRLFDPWEMPKEGLGPGGLGRFQRPLRGFMESAQFAPEKRDFQIAKKRDELLAALEDHQVVVMVGTTGSGKSTYVPWLLLTGGVPGGLSKWAQRGPICVTQPRIQATRQVPRFIAHSLNGTSLGVGSQIGFSHSKADEYDRRARLIFKTDGKLINDIVSGAVGNFSIVMIDEAHERSVNIDLILGLFRDQLYLYPDLRLIIASATIDFSSFIGYFYPDLRSRLVALGNQSYLDGYGYFKEHRQIPFIYSTGRINPITEHWWGAVDEKDELLPGWWQKINDGQVPSRDQLPQVIADLVQQLCERPDALSCGDHILAFLPGSREIDQTVSNINALQLHNVVALPLYAQRPLDEQEAALNPSPSKHPHVFGRRRVVVSTNVAETSLTVEGVKYVIDSGYIKESFWNPITQVSELQTLRHSQRGCQQRWGRAGRTAPGHAFMLYTRQQYRDIFPTSSTPALARSSLEQVLLTAKAAGVRTIRTKDGGQALDFAWMPQPNPSDSERLQAELSRAHDSLLRQETIDQDGDLTALGLELRGMPVELDVARIFAEAERYAMGIEVATLLPFLKLERGLQAILQWERTWDSYRKLAVRQHHLDLTYGCHDDLELYLKLWMLWEGRTDEQRRLWADEDGINYTVFQGTIEDERRRLIETAMDWRKAEKRPVSLDKIDALRALIASCLPNELYVPLERSSEHLTGSASRFSLPEVLTWESPPEDAGQYEEYDEDVAFDGTYSADALGRSGVYRRLNPLPGNADETASLVELAPSSICFGRGDADLVVVSQRRANFRRPARAKVLGMNVIRVERDWLTSIQGSPLQRALLFSSLSRKRCHEDRQRTRLRLLLPWLISRGSVVTGKIENLDPQRGLGIDLHLTPPTTLPVAELRHTPLKVQGWLPHRVTEREPMQFEAGQEISAQVMGYDLSETGDPVVVLGEPRSSHEAFRKFAKKHRSRTTLQVRTHRVLEDPLGLSPVFVVSEVATEDEAATGLEIPMADTDFCGNSHPQAYYGRRFAVGEPLDVELEEIYPVSMQVRLSRGQQLMREYAKVMDGDFQIVTVDVTHVDKSGVYLALADTGYVGFTRRGLWPSAFAPKPGDRVKARLRRADRSVPETICRLEEGQPLPEETDLGIDLDLLVWPAYQRFSSEHKVGDLTTITVDKALDNGNLLVRLEEGIAEGPLRDVIYESELGLDAQGRLKSARDYRPGTPETAIVYKMEEDRAKVFCSIFRVWSPPADLQRSNAVRVRVLAIRQDQREPKRLWLTCSLREKYQVLVRAPAIGLQPPLSVGDVITARIDRIDSVVHLVQGTLLGRSDGQEEADV